MGEEQRRTGGEDHYGVGPGGADSGNTMQASGLVFGLTFMERIKILHIIDSLGRRGGAEKQLALELGSVDPRRFDNSVCYLHAPDYLVPAIESMGIPVYQINVKGKKQWLSGVRRLRRLVKSLDVDLIHTSLYESDVIGGMVGRLTGVPVVSTLTNTCYEREWLVDNSHQSRLKLELTRLSRALVARYCNRHVIAVSNAVKTSAVRQLGIPEEKVIVINRALSPGLVEANGHQNGAASTAGETPDGSFPVLINVGRLDPQKGQRYVIESMPSILRRFPQAALLIVGEGELKPQLEALAKELAVGDQVHFLGQRSDVPQLLEASDIFMFPSLYEGCPNALIEAIAMGLPSVASDIEPVVEVTQGGKFAQLVPPRDPESLAEGAIRFASRPQEAKALGLEARAAVRHRFAVNNIVDQRMAAYERCVAKAGA